MGMEISQWMKMVQINTADGVRKEVRCIVVQHVAVLSARYVQVKCIV
jgi:hypothetical protein